MTPPREIGPCRGEHEGEGEGVVEDEVLPNMAKKGFLLFFPLDGRIVVVVSVVVAVVNGGMVCDARIVLVAGDDAVDVEVDVLLWRVAAVDEEDGVEELDRRGGKLKR